MIISMMFRGKPGNVPKVGSPRSLRESRPCLSPGYLPGHALRSQKSTCRTCNCAATGPWEASKVDASAILYRLASLGSSFDTGSWLPPCALDQRMVLCSWYPSVREIRELEAEIAVEPRAFSSRLSWRRHSVIHPDGEKQVQHFLVLIGVCRERSFRAGAHAGPCIRTMRQRPRRLRNRRLNTWFAELFRQIRLVRPPRSEQGWTPAGDR